MKTIDLTGKTVLITGAGSGIGRAIVLRLAQEGMSIVLVGRNTEKLRETATLTGRPENMLILPADITTHEGIDSVMQGLERLDILINNAGMALNSSFEKTSEADFDRIMALNVKAPFVLCQHCLPLLRQSDCPTIINMGSVVSYQGYANQAAYAASKHALLGMTKALAREVYAEGIRVHLIAPGGVYTDMIAIARPDLSPDGMIQADEVAEAVAYLIRHRGNAVIDEIRLHRMGKEPFQ